MRHVASLSAVALLFITASQACLPGVRFDSDEEDKECSEPPPPSGGWCPAYWSCIDGEWMDTAGACPDPCPEVQPSSGEACNAPIGHTCTYQGYPCGDQPATITMECTNEGWVTLVPRCLPEPECPDEVPIAGGDCSEWPLAYACPYEVETACGLKLANASCDGSSWSVTLDSTCESCAELDSAAACSADAACRWLVPGCGEPPLETEGCYPAANCNDDCDEGEQCTMVVHNPCWNDLCDQCGAEANVCLPAP
jgi:hypothetical protein